jgi:membrane dipeptidase
VTADYRQYWNQSPRSKKPRGLTAFGEAVIKRIAEKQMIIDLAHADVQTFNDIINIVDKPVIVSHSGAHDVSPFHRFLTDSQILAIRKNGGIIGLWPMYFWKVGMKTPDDFKSHVRHILSLAGEDHLAIGTDLHGVLGYMEGYHGPYDSIMLTQLLLESGLSEMQVRKALGLNFIRVVRNVCR